MKMFSSNATTARQVGETIRDLNEHGASIYISRVSKDYNYIMIQDTDTKEVYFDGRCGTWLAMYTLLGRNQILKRIT